MMGAAVGPSLTDPAFQSGKTDQAIFDSINQGHEATSMISWGEILSAEQIEDVVAYLMTLKE